MGLEIIIFTLKLKMGLFYVENCIFTDLPAKNYTDKDSFDGIEYTINLKNKNFFFRLPYYAPTWNKEIEFFIESKWLFKSLLINNNWFDNQEAIITIEALELLLKTKSYPKTPKQKLDNLFLSLMQLQEYDGSKIIVYEKLLRDEIWINLYFKNIDECNFYFQTLNNQGYIEGEYHPVNNIISKFNVTFNGQNYAISIQEQGENSKKCFIAMSFNKSLSETRMAIKNALSNTGFEEIIIDEKDIDSDKTINDEIIASLKSCKFCIADFTLQSKGVYFESGFALGQNKKVIYTCQEDDFENAHFDIKPLQHIIYKTPEDLEKALIHKINAWIK